MAVKDYGAGSSGYLDPEGRAFETTVYQASKPVLDTELNLTQDISQFKNLQVRAGVPSGWLTEDVVDSSESNIYEASATANGFKFPAMSALVNGWPVLVRYTNSSTTSNEVDLGAGPAGVAAKRTDLVILECWRRLISASPDTDGKSASGRIWRNGNVKIASADDATLNLTDDILDVSVGAETTKRVQIQYRIRVIQGVDLDAYPLGMDDPTVVNYTPPVTALAPDGVAGGFPYVSMSPEGDPGLWRAGSGSPAGMGTVDGYMYAVPLCAVFRRNTTAFDRDSNQNGGVASPGPSDRPDGYFHDIIEERDILDLRTSVSRTGWDYQELLYKNVNFLFDNALQVEQHTTPIGGGTQGHTTLWADEIGPTDNPGANLIRNFDSVSRTFSDRPILETVWVKYVPTDQNSGSPTWSNPHSDFITIDPTSLPIYPYPSASLAAVAPSTISIVDVLKVIGVWDGLSGSFETFYCGDYGDTVSSGSYLNGFHMPYITGLGKVPVGSIELGTGFGAFIGQSNVEMYVQLVISYPSGKDGTAGGLTKTPAGDFGAASFVNEVPANLPASSPYYYSQMQDTSFDEAHREVNLTYRTLTQSFVQYSNSFSSGIPADHVMLFVPDRVHAVSSITNQSTTGTYTGTVTISDDGHFLTISKLAGDWSDANALLSHPVQIDYTGIRPVPDNDCQFTIWYEARAPQTIRDDLLGTSLQVIPRYVSPHMYCLVSGSGSMDEAYPFPYQYVQSPGVYPSSGGTFTGDHELTGTGDVSISNFDATSGFLQIPTLIPAVPSPQNLILERDPGDIDAEGRSYFKEVPAGYIPSVFGQPLSDPKAHKNCVPMICELAGDGAIGPKGTLLLVMFSRWAEFDSENKVAFDPDLSANYTSASIYRLKGNPVNVRRT